MIRQQLNDPGSIRMTDGTTFAYRFTLTPKEAVSLGLPPQTPQAGYPAGSDDGVYAGKRH